MTWPELQALLEHWKTEPPLQVMAARYLGIPPRAARPRMMTKDEAITALVLGGLAPG